MTGLVLWSHALIEKYTALAMLGIAVRLKQ